MHACCPAHAGASRAKVLYSPSELWSLPNVVTLAGIYRAIPLPSVLSEHDSGLAGVLQELPVAFDAYGMWQDAEQATQWALDNLHGLCNSTASLVVLQVDPPHSAAQLSWLLDSCLTTCRAYSTAKVPKRYCV